MNSLIQNENFIMFNYDSLESGRVNSQDQVGEREYGGQLHYKMKNRYTLCSS